MSPSRHAEFSDTDSLLDWVELLAAETGLPVGIKSAVGDLDFWDELTTLMATPARGVDFVTIDGGEGGTGAAPLIFTDTVSLPFQVGFARVYKMFAERGLHEQVVFVGAGKLGLPDNAIVAFALGCDMVNVAREAMLAIGCIQAQKCHTDTCPTGVATQNPWLTRGLDPTLKSVRVANYIKTLRRDLLKVAEACGVEHPGLIDTASVEILDGRTAATALDQVYGYRPGWGLPSAADQAAIAELMTAGSRRAAAPRRHRRQPAAESQFARRSFRAAAHRPRAGSAGEPYVDGVPVGAQSFPGRLAQPGIVRPGAEGDVGDELRADPLGLVGVLARHRQVERRVRLAQGVEPLLQVAQVLFAESGADLADVRRAGRPCRTCRPAASRSSSTVGARPTLYPATTTSTVVGQRHLDPCRRPPAGLVRRGELLGDHALQAEFPGRVQQRRPGVAGPVRRRVHRFPGDVQSLQGVPPVDVGQRREVGAVEVQQVEEVEPDRRRADRGRRWARACACVAGGRRSWAPRCGRARRSRRRERPGGRRARCGGRPAPGRSGSRRPCSG